MTSTQRKRSRPARSRKRNLSSLLAFKRNINDYLFSGNKRTPGNLLFPQRSKRTRLNPTKTITNDDDTKAKEPIITIKSKSNSNSNRTVIQPKSPSKSPSKESYSFTKPPPDEPSNNFLFDNRINYELPVPNDDIANYDNNNNNNHNHNHKRRCIVEINPKPHPQPPPSHSSSSSPRNRSFTYREIEEFRMKKLWTDFSNKPIMNELKFCQDTSFFVTSNSIAHKISNIIKILLSHYTAADPDDHTYNILDGLSCIGGNTYSFCKVFTDSNIYCNELDLNRYNALMYNMDVFIKHQLIENSDRIHYYNEDFLSLYKVLGADVCSCMDVIFLDPEWNGGDDYKQDIYNNKLIEVFDIGCMSLCLVIDNILNNSNNSGWGFINIKIIAIKLPKNYNQMFIHNKLKNMKLIKNKTFNIGQISFHNQKLLLIVKSFNNDDDDDDISGLSFNEIFNRLPNMITSSNSNSFKINVRDVVHAKVV